MCIVVSEMSSGWKDNEVASSCEGTENMSHGHIYDSMKWVEGWL